MYSWFIYLLSDITLTGNLYEPNILWGSTPYKNGQRHFTVDMLHKIRPTTRLCCIYQLSKQYPKFPRFLFNKLKTDTRLHQYLFHACPKIRYTRINLTSRITPQQNLFYVVEQSELESQPQAITTLFSVRTEFSVHCCSNMIRHFNHRSHQNSLQLLEDGLVQITSS